MYFSCMRQLRVHTHVIHHPPETMLTLLLAVRTVLCNNVAIIHVVSYFVPGITYQGECVHISRDDKQTDRRTDRQTDRRTDRQTGRQTDRKTDRQTDRQTDRSAAVYRGDLKR